MSERLDERLRRAARTYRRLGNHTAEGMFLEAADTIWELQTDNAKLRESVRRLMTQRDERLARAETDNAKLRELVSGLEHCCQGFDCDCCPLYDPSGTNHRRCESLERELGIEADA